MEATTPMLASPSSRISLVRSRRWLRTFIDHAACGGRPEMPTLRGKDERSVAAGRGSAGEVKFAAAGRTDLAMPAAIARAYPVPELTLCQSLPCARAYPVPELTLCQSLPCARAYPVP